MALTRFKLERKKHLSSWNKFYSHSVLQWYTAAYYHIKCFYCVPRFLRWHFTSLFVFSFYSLCLRYSRIKWNVVSRFFVIIKYQEKDISECFFLNIAIIIVQLWGSSIAFYERFSFCKKLWALNFYGCNDPDVIGTTMVLRDDLSLAGYYVQGCRCLDKCPVKFIWDKKRSSCGSSFLE